MSKQQSVSTIGFVFIILGIVGLGLAGVLVVTTSIGAQSSELTALRTQAQELEYESAGLRSQVEGLSSTSALALRASELGMVPNPYPAYVMLGTGKIVGTPTKVRGNEFPEFSGQAPKPAPSASPTPSPAPVASPSPSPVTTPSPVPPTPRDDEDTDPRPEDVVAADQPEQHQRATAPSPTSTPSGAPSRPVSAATPSNPTAGEPGDEG